MRRREEYLFRISSGAHYRRTLDRSVIYIYTHTITFTILDLTFEDSITLVYPQGLVSWLWVCSLHTWSVFDIRVGSQEINFFVKLLVSACMDGCLWVNREDDSSKCVWAGQDTPPSKTHPLYVWWSLGKKNGAWIVERDWTIESKFFCRHFSVPFNEEIVFIRSSRTLILSKNDKNWCRWSIDI